MEMNRGKQYAISLALIAALVLFGLLLLFRSSQAAILPGNGGNRAPQATGTPPSATPTSIPTGTACVGWLVVPSSDHLQSDNNLNGIAVSAPNDVWAVGSFYDGTRGRTLVERWNGSTWSIVPSPNPGQTINTLDGIAIAGPNDVWAVGHFNNNDWVHQTLVERWNGSTWGIILSPNIGTITDEFFALAIAAPNDVWAVGDSYTGSLYQTLVERWNGSTWGIVPSPNREGGTNELKGVVIAGPNDVWAVGYSAINPNFRTLMERWNGNVWSIVASPSQGASDSLNGITASPDGMWAVGSYSSGGHAYTLTERTTDPCVTPTPTITGTPPTATATGTATATATVATATPGGAPLDLVPEFWAGGGGYSCYGPPPAQYFLLTTRDTYAGRVQASTTMRFFGPYDTSMDISIPPFTGVYTYQYNCDGEVPCIGLHNPQVYTLTVDLNNALIETNEGNNTWSQTIYPPPTPTPCPPPPSATPTACAIEFTDVPPASTFYPFVRCLACRGIISGYADGTFKPNNNVSRGQLSKIVSNSAGFSDPQPNQMFEDVPVGSTFQVFIGRLASRYYVGGYPCGEVPSEPCVSPGYRPYFRPNTNATRGQISQIVSRTAGFVEPHTERTFQDVNVGSTFHDDIERLVARGVMSGYPCGGAGEPCVPPENRPYFRPNNNATRGQTSKIVANTFFPNCVTPHR